MAAGFAEPLLSGRLGKLGGLTALYYDHYFVLDEETLQYESSSGSRRMKTYHLDELQDCVRMPNRRGNEFTFVFSGERSGPVWHIHVRAKTDELAAEWALSALRARDRLRERRAAAPAAARAALSSSGCGTDAGATAAAVGAGGVGAGPAADGTASAAARTAEAGSQSRTSAGGTSAGAPAPPRPPPPPPPPPPSGPPDATGRPQVLTAAELMKRHLARKASVKLVEQRDEILRACADILAAEWGTPAEAHAAYDELSHRMDALGLAVEEGAWGSRLQIAKKGGGSHFDAEQLALATRAHDRASALCDFTARSRQLQQRAAHLRALHAALEANPELARERRIERLHAALHAALRVYREVIHAASAAADERRFEQARISGSLQADGDDLLCALPCASHGAFLVVQDELASLRRENASSRRFRASRAHIIAQQAIAVHTDVQLQLEHLGKPTPHDVSAERAELEATCAELQGEAAAHGTAATDEADADGI
ncbi:hypothetical protein KFE25_008897 [Diacronema lutheri]|uniref:PH domain-containing protein n=1 Tax=Diacronema lutheri TaxID=2081491 RepID=A0A8J5XWS3_DIALT|nr:hypothetical protein KFE25_008897 [Diacronema lutheri]